MIRKDEGKAIIRRAWKKFVETVKEFEGENDYQFSDHGNRIVITFDCKKDCAYCKRKIRFCTCAEDDKKDEEKAKERIGVEKVLKEMKEEDIRA